MLATLLPVDEEEIAAVAASMRSVPLTTLFGGYEVEAFEREFSELFGGTHAVAVTSGTTALLAALMAAEIGPGDEVIVTPFSFVASASVVVQVGATPVFADIDPQTFVMDPAAVARVLSSRTRAIIPVHQCGYPVDLTSLNEIIAGRNIVVIEDAAAAHGAMVDDRAVGTIGDFGCFSFNIGKIMRTGEGGMVMTPSAEAARRLRAIRVNGMEATADRVNRVNFLGCNFTMAQPMAALGRVQVRRFLRLSARRREIGEALRQGLQGLPVALPPDRPGLMRAYYSLPFAVAEELRPARDAIVADLNALGVPASIGLRQLLHQVDHLKPTNGHVDCRVAEAVRGRLFFIDPLPSYTDADVTQIVEAIRTVVGAWASNADRATA